ncbi:MAG: CDP-diacylglycerol--glycerol-3-phosphate 3-phosphatidyltransferase [Candidatus Woesearchaeota archaeon]
MKHSKPKIPKIVDDMMIKKIAAKDILSEELGGDEHIHFTRKDILTIPNFLTALRIFLAPFFMFAVLGGKYIIAFVIILLAALTDFFDGLIARRYNMQSSFGTLLDPIADKIFVFCAIVALLLRFGFPLWLGAIIISRDLFILMAGLLFVIMHKHSVLKPNLLGKISTFFQMTSLTIYIISSSYGYYDSWIGILLYLTAALTVVSGLVYAVKGYYILKEE